MNSKQEINENLTKPQWKDRPFPNSPNWFYLISKWLKYNTELNRWEKRFTNPETKEHTCKEVSNIQDYLLAKWSLTPAFEFIFTGANKNETYQTFNIKRQRSNKLRFNRTWKNLSGLHQ